MVTFSMLTKKIILLYKVLDFCYNFALLKTKCGVMIYPVSILSLTSK